jgi:hypothetical protein
MFKSYRCNVTGPCTALILAAFCTQATATTIPATAVEVTADGGTAILTYGTVNGSACNGTDGCETSTGTASSLLNVSTNGSNSGSNPANAGGSGEVTVFYEVVGPVSGVPVTLDISGSATTSATGPNAEGLGYIEYGNGDLYTCSSTVAGPCGTEASSGSLNSVQFSNEFTNTLYDLQVIASGSSAGAGSFSASANALLSLDSSWLAGNPGYSLQFGPAPVPLPATVWLMLAGLGCLGLWRRAPFLMGGGQLNDPTRRFETVRCPTWN